MIVDMNAPTFDFQPRTRIVFGDGALQQVGELAQEYGARRVLLVTDKGIVGAGHPARASELLVARGIEVILFDQVSENPTTVDVDRCVEVARAARVDLLIGLGGGSSMDTAKGCNFLLTNGGRMQDYWGVGKASKEMLPLIAIPTTAGTGSECQSFALICDEVTHQKMACGDPKACAKVAILDPRLTLSQPSGVTACTGIDALAHCLETAVTTKRTPLSAMFSREAFALCMHGFRQVIEQPEDVEARGKVQLGAALAGLAIETSMLGAAHSAANPLTAHFGIVHGQAVGLMLPAVIRFNAQDARARQYYHEHAVAAGLHSVDELLEALQELLELAGIGLALASYSIRRELFPGLAGEAARQWTAKFNPRPILESDFENLYREVLG